MKSTCQIFKLIAVTWLWKSDSRLAILVMSAIICLVDRWFRYSISQEICTRFCCALLCCGYVIVHNEFTWNIYPYSSGFLCWHWGTGAIVRLPQCQWSKPDGYGKISQCITTTKHSKAKTVCIFLGIYCTCIWPTYLHVHPDSADSRYNNHTLAKRGIVSKLYVQSVCWPTSRDFTQCYTWGLLLQKQFLKQGYVIATHNIVWGSWCQKQVSQAWKNNCIPQYSVGCKYLSLPLIPASDT